MTMLRPNELLLTEANAAEWHRPTVDGTRRRGGLVPRPRGTAYAGERAALDFPLIPQGEWGSRLAEKVAEKSLNSDVRLTGDGGQPIPSRDQNGRGYCWAHSGVSALLVQRAVAGQPYADLSAYAVACVIKQYADEGGWGAQGLDFLMERGCPTAKYWPQQSVSRSNDRPETWADAARHKVTEGWVDLGAAQYDRNLTFAQLATCLLLNVPVIVDYNWWSHSVCAVDLVDGARVFPTTRGDAGKKIGVRAFDKLWGMNDPVTAGMGGRIWNSWGDSWSDRGMGTLPANKFTPDGAAALRASVVSTN